MDSDLLEALATIGVYVAVVAVIVGIFQLPGLFVDQSVAVKALENQGFSNITIIEKDWLFVGFKGCDASDSARFPVIATNPLGKRVEVMVCSGWLFKGATIRTK